MEAIPTTRENAGKERNMKLKLAMGAFVLAGAFLAGAPSAFSQQVSVGIVIGAPPAPRVIAIRPPCPEPQYENEYAWVDGYWYPTNGHYYWHRGYWTRPPYADAVWMVPRYEGGRYYGGYWQGPRGRFEHDHHWDHEHNRDRDRWRDDDHHDNGKHKGWYKDHGNKHGDRDDD